MAVDSRQLTWYKTPSADCWSLYLGRRRLPIQVEQLDSNDRCAWRVVGPGDAVSDATSLADAKVSAVALAQRLLGRATDGDPGLSGAREPPAPRR
jgi:hypothetical protein